MKKVERIVQPSVSYKEIKPELKKEFEKLISEPEQGIEHAEAFSEKEKEEIKHISTIEKKILWKNFKSSAKLELAKRETSQEAQEIFDALSKTKLDTTKYSIIKAIIADPSNKEYGIDEELIKHVESLDKAAKALLVAEILEIEEKAEALSEHQNHKIGSKFLTMIETVWDKLSPILYKYCDLFIGWGASKVAEIIDKKVEGELGDILSGMVLEAGSSLKGVAEDESKLAGAEEEDFA